MHQPLRILLVDDDEVDALLVERAVKRTELPIQLQRASNGAEALALLEAKSDSEQPPFDIVFLDLNMPIMGGFEFLETVRNSENLRSLVVFVLSTSNHEEDLANAYRLGVAGYLVKSTVSPEYGRLVALLDSYANAVTLPR